MSSGNSRRIGRAFGEKIIAVIESILTALFSFISLVLRSESFTMVHCKEGEEMRYTTVPSRR
jgi:hypothetical protein